MRIDWNAQHIVLTVRLSHQGSATRGTRLSQVMQTGKTATLTLPISDGILDELKRRVFPEVADRKHGLEHRLQATVVPLGRQPGHLQKPLVRLFLDLNEVGNRDRRPDS